jgi:hypothetical protein
MIKQEETAQSGESGRAVAGPATPSSGPTSAGSWFKALGHGTQTGLLRPPAGSFEQRLSHQVNFSDDDWLGLDG